MIAVGFITKTEGKASTNSQWGNDQHQMFFKINFLIICI